MSAQLPKYEALEPELTKMVLSSFKGQRTGWVKVGEKGYILPHGYTEQGEGFYNFKARPSDTWVVSYPRSGTTWTQELVWLLSNDLDFESAKKRYLAERFPFLEYSLLNEVIEEFVMMDPGDEEKQQLSRDIFKPGYEVLESLPSPRFIKSHFPLSLLPGILDSGCKIVYVARNPKDVVVSRYHMSVANHILDFQGDFQEFWNYFRNDLTLWSPYWEHLKEAWAQRNHPNLLFMFYEEMQWDLQRAIRKIANFLGKTYDDEQIAKLADYLDVKNFRDNPKTNASELVDCGLLLPGTFIRKGISGGWRDTFTAEHEASADAWIEENLKDTDLTFPYIKIVHP